MFNPRHLSPFLFVSHQRYEHIYYGNAIETDKTRGGDGTLGGDSYYSFAGLYTDISAFIIDKFPPQGGNFKRKLPPIGGNIIKTELYTLMVWSSFDTSLTKRKI